MSGLPVIVPDNISSGPTDPGVVTAEEELIPYEDRFPAQHQLDVSATYPFSNRRESWRGTIGLSLINVYDRENVINIFQNNATTDRLFRTAVGFTPDIQVSLRF